MKSTDEIVSEIRRAAGSGFRQHLPSDQELLAVCDAYKAQANQILELSEENQRLRKGESF